MKKRVSNLIVMFGIAIFLVLQACAPAREMAYITDAERDSAQRIISTYSNSIHPGDLLYIYVYSEIPESVIPFNQETHNLSHSSSVSGYLVDEAGAITFPVLGKLTAAGLTYDSLAHVIEQRLIGGGYLLDPLVTISPMNFRVSVMGEVNRPQELHITGERLTILEALAMCGDLTVYGQRENITVVRSKKGEATPITIDLTKKTIFDSEVYYLQSNDIVYVEPNKKKKREATLDENWPKYASASIGLGSFIVGTVRRYLKLQRRF